MIRWSMVILLFALPCACSSQPTADVDSSGSKTDAGTVDGAPADAGATVDARGAPPEASSPPAYDAAAGDSSAQGCGEFAGEGIYTCSADGNSRGECPGDASPMVQACARGCLREPAGTDAVCMGTTATLDCSGSYGKTKAADGDYYVTSFGCWIDQNGAEHIDPGDNCLPSCFAQAKAAGLCDASSTGKDCEEKITWYTADAARFGCLAHLRVTDPTSGKAVIAIALDYGPSCTVENGVSHAVLDASGRIDRYLFGSDQGASDRSLVHVVEVAASYALGPVP